MASGHYEQNSKEKEENYEESESSDSSSEDEEGEALTEQLEKDWLRTLAALKKKDPRIYDKDIKFYQSSDEETKTKKSKKEKPVFLHDVQRKTLIETEGAPPPDEKIRYEEEEEEEEEILPVAPSYYEEQNELKQKFMEAAPSSDEDEDLLVKKDGSNIKEDEGAEEEYRMYLKGKKKKLKKDKRLAPELSILKDYWSKPDLDEGEQFLRDYILNRGYKDKDKDKLPSYKDIVEDESFDEEEKVLQKQEDYEREYNFRFEEPDKNFIKSHPRKIKDSVRQEDTKRVEKRKKILERKKKEMEKKQEELKRIKKKKRKEIMDKIAELKEITGNSSLGINDLDLDQDFDAKQHDEMMQKMFNDKYYKEEGGEYMEMEKPVFSDDGWDETYDDGGADQAGYTNDGEEPGCSYDAQDELDIEDPDFNMDADFDPSERRSKKEMKRKKKSKNEKPIFNADEMTFDEYFDEYYKLDYEDLIEDQPCRFQYRSVVPNDFGLSTHEILNTDDKELNGWCPLRKIVSYRTEQEEFNDEMIYYKRGKNMNRKEKFIPSFFKSVNGENDDDENENGSWEYSDRKMEPSKKKQKRLEKEVEQEEDVEGEEGDEEEEEMDTVDVAVGRGSGTDAENGLPKKKTRKKKKKKKKPQQKGNEKKEENNEEIEANEKTNETLLENPETKKRKKKKQQEEDKKGEPIKNEKESVSLSENQNPKSQYKKKRKREEDEEIEKEDKAIVEESPKDKKSSKSDKTKSDKKAKKKQKTKNDSNGPTPKTKSTNSSMTKTRLKKKNRAEMWRKKTVGDTKHNEDLNISLSNERLKAYGLNPKKFKYLKVADHKSSKK